MDKKEIILLILSMIIGFIMTIIIFSNDEYIKDYIVELD